MKNLLKVVVSILFVMIMVILFNGIVSAKGIPVYINGQLQNYDQPPVVDEGRTLVPLRGIFESMGAEVSWDSKTNIITATKQEIVVKLTIGSKTVYVNNVKKTIDVPAKTINNRTLVPLRFVSEVFGGTVTWDSKTNAITIISAPDSITFTQEDVNALIGKVYKKEDSALDPKVQSELKTALAGNRAELISNLIDLYIKNDPNWTTLLVEQFTHKYLQEDLHSFAEVSLAEETSKDQAVAINKLLSFLDSDESIQTISYILENHENSSVRYNGMYYFSKSTSSLAIPLIIERLSEENDPSVYSNGGYALLKMVGNDIEKMNVMFQASISSESKQQTVKTVVSNYGMFEFIEAWKLYLNQKKLEGTEEEKTLASYFLGE